MKVLVFVEQRDAKLKSSAFEAITTGRKLAGSAADVAAVIVGQNIAGLADELKGYGADTVYTVDRAEFANYNVIAYASGVEKAINEFDASIVLGVASPMGRDLFPRLAARFDSGLLTDLVDIKLEGDFVSGLKPMYAGKCLAEVALQNTAKQFVTLRPNVFAAKNSGEGSAAATALEAFFDDSVKLETTEIRKGASEKPDLTEATRIISGGRAMGSADAFKVLNECADTLGATVGASRAAVDSGYAPHDMQVGQTGKTVNPNLYVACGISGSIQHMAGMRTSKVIVAINTDPEAPIFTVADYGIVADLFEAVPKLNDSLKSMLS